MHDTHDRIITSVNKENWSGTAWHAQIIGYRKRAEQPAPAIAPELVERMVALVCKLRDLYSSEAYDSIDWVIEVQELADKVSPIDPDLTLAKSIVGDAEAIALAIKAARENGRG